MKPSFLKSILDEHVAPVLAEYKFKRRKSTWNRRINGIVHVIHFQVSKGYDPRKREMFTIEVGVAVDAVENALKGKLPKTFEASHCVAIARIGDLSAAGYDTWWSLDCEADVPGVASDVVRHLRAVCLPALDRIRTLENVREFIFMSHSYRPKAPMYPGVRLALAALCYIIGDREQYEKLRIDLLRGHPRYGHDMWVDRMMEVDARLHQHAPTTDE